MNRYLPWVPVLGIVVIATSLPQPVFAKEGSKLAAQAKQVTVRIEGQETTGTGTIVKRNGDSYVVLTCWHVVNAEGSFEIATSDGEIHQATEVKSLDDDIDMAILIFNSSTSYKVAKLGDSEKIAAGTNSFVASYPDPIPGIPERAYIFQNANIVSKLSTGEQGYQIVHSNPTTGGSSGGGIFDRDGKLIGVNGETTSDAEGRVSYGLGIPLELYLATQNNFTIPDRITPPQDFASLGRRKLNQKDYQGAISDFDRALASNPDDIDVLSGRGSAYYRLGEYQSAIADFDAVLQRNSNNPTFFFYRGNSYDELGESQLAIADFKEAIRLNPENAVAYYNRGISYDKLEEYEKAIADFNEAIRLNPENAAAYYNRGISYDKLGESGKANADFNEAIRLNPDYAQAYNNRGNRYDKLGESGKAIAEFDEAIRLNPENAVAYYNRGISYHKLGEAEKAIADFNEAIRLNPDYAQAYNNRGNRYSELGEIEKAIADFDEAIRLNPENAVAYNNRGNNYSELGEPEKAIADFNEAIRLDPEDAFAYYNRGISYNELGESQKAIDSFQQAADLFQQQGNSQQYQSTLDVIRQLQQ